MLSEDNTVPLSLSDDEPEERVNGHPVGGLSTKAASLLEPEDDILLGENQPPSKLRLDLSQQVEEPHDNSTKKVEDLSSLSQPFGSPTEQETAGSSSSQGPAATLPVRSLPSPDISPFSNAKLPRSITPIQAEANAQEPKYLLTILVEDYEKRGEGMNAYLVYKVVSTCENVQGYSDRTYEVWRRFSDFLGLHDKLVEKHQVKGVVVPAAPEKSISAMTKAKTSEPSLCNETARRRARQLQRFLSRVVQHPRMRIDCDVRDFLTMETDLPHAGQTVALSSAGVKRMFKSVGEVFSKMAFHMEEGDRWFEQTQSHVDELDESLRKVLTLADSLSSSRKDLAAAQETMSRGLSMLASCEESTSLARALSHLTETEECAAALWAKQAEMDSTRLSESLSEYVGLLSALKDVFGERVKVWQSWQNAQQTLQKKREQKARLELSGKNDKANVMKNEIDETGRKMDQLEAEFGDLSKLIREEVGRFETQRRHDMKKMLIDYLEGLVQTHREMLKLWEKFEPETAAIIV